MKLFLILCRIILFFALTGLVVEHLINTQSSTILLFTAFIIEIALFYFLIIPLFKNLLK